MPFGRPYRQKKRTKRQNMNRLNLLELFKHGINLNVFRLL